MQAPLPVLYSFRRCPYAMRARMALAYAGIRVELREVVLRDMPAELLSISPRATVPVMQLPGGRVLQESMDIVEWAIHSNDPDGWRPDRESIYFEVGYEFLQENDTAFKAALDRYKYADRYPNYPPETYREQGEIFLTKLEMQLQTRRFLFGDDCSVIDVCIFPFVRQFAHVDTDWFYAAPYPALQSWLDAWLASGLFNGVMQKYPRWQPGDAVTVFPGEAA